MQVTEQGNWKRGYCVMLRFNVAMRVELATLQPKSDARLLKRS